LQDKYLHALKIIKVLKKERATYARACKEKTTQLENEKLAAEQISKLIKESIGVQTIELVRCAKRKLSDPKQIEQLMNRISFVFNDSLLKHTPSNSY
jgi:hypothetical protein